MEHFLRATSACRLDEMFQKEMYGIGLDGCEGREEASKHLAASVAEKNTGWSMMLCGTCVKIGRRCDSWLRMGPPGWTHENQDMVFIG